MKERQQDIKTKTNNEIQQRKKEGNKERRKEKAKERKENMKSPSFYCSSAFSHYGIEAYFFFSPHFWMLVAVSSDGPK